MIFHYQKHTVLNYCSGEATPQDLTTVNGTSIWAGDGVHLTSNASRVAARKLMADLAGGSEEGEPVNKRARLESVVPSPAPAKKKNAATGQPPTSPPRPVPPSPPLWLSGQLPPTQERIRPRIRPPPTQPEGGGDRCAATTAAAAGDHTRGRECRTGAASAADGATGKGNLKNSHKADNK
jgi:hypothetical protein